MGYETVRQFLLQRIEASDLSEQDIAFESGVSASTIARLKKGEHVLKGDSLDSLLNFFGRQLSHESGACKPTKQATPLPLSPTEEKVFAFLCKDDSIQQIADKMDRSYNTIHVHVRNIYRKLGIRNLSDLTAKLHQKKTVEKE